jgi:hypothetical protein
MIKLLTNLLTRLLFGRRADGEILPAPTFKSTYPTHRPDEQQWARDYNFGARYGHRGSFYQPSYF